MHLRDTIILLLAQHAALGLLYSRSPAGAQLFTKYSTTFALSALVSCSLFRLVRCSFNRNSTRPGSSRGCSGAGTCFVRVGVDDHDFSADVNSELGQAKADHSQAQQEISVSRKNFAAFTVSEDLLSRLASVSHSLSEDRRGLSAQGARMLGLILALFQYALLVGKRIRFLSAVVSEQQRKLSQLLVAHLELRSRYLNLMTISVQSRESIKRLEENPGCEVSECSKAQDVHSRLTLEAEAATKDCGFHQTLAWTVVTRFDDLQTEYGRLLATVDLLKKTYVDFHENLKEVASILQATRDTATLGLQRATCLRTLTFKQLIMRIPQGLELSLLNIYYMLVQAGLTINREMGRMVVISSVDVLPVPGSEEDAVRKLKAIYKNQTTSQNSENESEGDRDDGEPKYLALGSGYFFRRDEVVIDKLTENLPDIATSMGRKLSRDTNLRSSPSIPANDEGKFMEETKMTAVASIL